jgi:uncharacterized protein with von Willebrand factor type A (vWA) domain
MITATGRSTEAVVRDFLDRADFDQTLVDLAGMPAARDRLAMCTDFAEDLMADAHAAFLRARAELTTDQLDPTHTVHRAVMEEVFKTDSFRSTREFTVGDSLAAGMAVTALTNRLPALFEKLGDVREKARAAQQALDELERAEAQAGETPDADSQALFDELAAALDVAEAELGDAVDAAAPRIGKVARQAAGEAEQAVAESVALGRAWGQDPGDLARMDPATRLRLQQRMASPRMRKIAEAFGRIQWEMRAIVQNSWINGPSEVHEVKLSNDVAHIVPSELIGLAVPELTLDFYRRFAERTLLCYELKERQKLARGPIVVVLDASESMDDHGRIEWAIGLTLALLDCAKTQRRGFECISFHGRNVMESFRFVKPADFELSKMLDLASVAASGGTEFEGPLARAAGVCTDDHADTGLEGADIVFITDGLAKVSPAWLDEFRAARQAAGFRVWGIAIQQAVPQVLTDICDLTARVDQLFGAGEISAIFQRVAQNYQPGSTR